MAKKAKKIGSLYLIPTTLGDNEPLEVLPLSVKRTIESITYFIVENEKSARRFIKKIHPRKSQKSLLLMALNKFTDPGQIPGFLDPCLQGHDVGVLSEAGSPAVADPGAEVVILAHEKGIPVIPLVGPSSLLLALMASGLNGQQFAFHGYLPIEKSERKKMIKALEKESREKGQTQLFIETPYRNNSLIDDLLATLSKDTYLCIATDLTLPAEFISTKKVFEWKENVPDLHKRPTMFLLKA
ncbi:MAG: SAM-dependent methyltransferase [Eudoraea sp.]|nr:SAM-dependent methyltransferase [Eudoraea sp.]